MQWYLCERDGFRNLVAIDAVKEHLSQGLVQRALNEVVGLAGADLLARLKEISFGLSQISGHSRRPFRCLGFQQFWRPSAEVERAPTNAIGESGKAAANICLPRQAPHF